MYNNQSNNNGILSLINPPIYMKDIHLHPLIYSYSLDRNKYGSSWNCNICNSQFNYNNPSFYCTFCDFDLCQNCLAEYKLDQIIFYDCNENDANNLKNIQQNSNNFQWQKKFKNHIHFLTLIVKQNKTFSWKCNKCSQTYQNIESSYYCSLCDYYICKNCIEEKPIIEYSINSFNVILPIKSHDQKRQNSDFQINSFKILNESYKKSNLIYSPLTIQILLYSLSNWVSDQTLNELKNVFCFQELQNQNNLDMKLLLSLSSIPSLNIANSIYCPIDPSPNFKTYIENYKICCSTKKEELNQFIKQETKEKVCNYLDQKILFGIVLSNVLYFKEDWKKKFTENAFNKSFFVENNVEKKVKMMNLCDNFKYYKDKSIEVIEIPYKTDNLSSLILLPSKDISIDSMISELSLEILNKLYNKLTLSKVDLTIPKFNINENKYINLEVMLKKIGINIIFNSNLFDFTSFFENKSNFPVSEVLQTNFIDFDESGQENDLFPIINQPLQPIQDMIVNRPFLLIIRNNKFEIGKDIILIAKIKDL